MEKNLVINNRTLNYKGLFRFDEFFSAIDLALAELGYQRQEKKNEEFVSPSGKKIYVELRPFKDKTHYVMLMIKLKISMDNVTETTFEVDGVKRTFQRGDIGIAFDAWSITDYQNRWGMRPVVWFLKAVINKYIYKFPLEESFFGELVTDTTYLVDQIKACLNLYKYRVPQEKPSFAAEQPELKTPHGFRA